MVRWIYNLCFPWVFVLLLPGYLRRMVRRGNFRRNFGQRLGFYSAEVKARLAGDSSRMWIQAVSVGEMIVALKLIDALRERSPDLLLILSTTTTTGYQLAASRVGPNVALVYTPIDLAGAVRRAFDFLRPTQLIIVDGGLWPNQLWEAKRRGIPTALVNARLSPRSERRFRRFKTLAASMFRLLDLVCVPEETDLTRWESLGVSPLHIQHTGSIKFDDRSTGDGRPFNQDLSQILRAVVPSPTAPVLLAGSTHAGEEKLIAESFLRLRRKFENLFLIIAPRHVERTPELRAELTAMGLRVVTRSSLSARSDTHTSAASSPDMLLLDTTGELRDWYAFATVVFIGKSLIGVGGQNPVEAITAGCPVVFGPHMENFAEITGQLLAADAAVRISDATELENAFTRLLADPSQRKSLSEKAQRLIDIHRGAAGRTADLLLAHRTNFT